MSFQGTIPFDSIDFFIFNFANWLHPNLYPIYYVGANVNLGCKNWVQIDCILIICTLFCIWVQIGANNKPGCNVGANWLHPYNLNPI